MTDTRLKVMCAICKVERKCWTCQDVQKFKYCILERGCIICGFTSICKAGEFFAEENKADRLLYSRNVWMCTVFKHFPLKKKKIQLKTLVKLVDSLVSAGGRKFLNY